ncbi:aldo/keto reductase [Niabella ginsengisoli]|uniref:Aldo/keto reductase n=1 Tax=Niabella ginsengisoli TaxID=522298 RepID=A0ABS9SND8_9BACT|nr:aldo/keto reductase [Niabella ginsengisoli]MCH5599870.1 aldo/keto reductase [Niabella ginsengisoli]
MQLERPKVISGTTSLGNIYKEMPFPEKMAIVKEYIDASPGTPMFDSAGKYGAGLALEVLGQCLKELGIKKDEVLISNKLAWVRKPLTTPEPTFEPGVWHNLKYDAEQKISYEGILNCFENGNELLGEYDSQFASVHDPDEYLAAAKDDNDYQKRYDDILEAYRALADLKSKGVVAGVGIGAKDWKSIEKISKDVKLDWVMIANSYTIYNHPKELVDFVASLHKQNITIINSAVFHGGFLMGSDFFNYTELSRENPEHKKYYEWRDKFNQICIEYNIEPPAAAIYFGLHVPGIKSIALNSSNPKRVRHNIEMANANIPPAFWQRMKEEGLIDKNYPHL